MTGDKRFVILIHISYYFLSYSTPQNYKLQLICCWATALFHLWLKWKNRSSRLESCTRLFSCCWVIYVIDWEVILVCYSIYIRLCIKMYILLFKKLFYLLYYFTLQYILFFIFSLYYLNIFFYSLFTIYLGECAKREKNIIK